MHQQLSITLLPIGGQHLGSTCVVGRAWFSLDTHSTQIFFLVLGTNFREVPSWLMCTAGKVYLLSTIIMTTSNSSLFRRLACLLLSCVCTGAAGREEDLGAKKHYDNYTCTYIQLHTHASCAGVIERYAVCYVGMGFRH